MVSAIRIACSLLAAILMASAASAFDFYVGGDGGWVQKPSEAYNHWAGRMRFQVHDKIVFKYNKGEDSVLVVEEDDYWSCNLTNPIKKMTSGASVFHFDRSGPFFFVSGKPGNCIKGQKLVVVVMAERHKKKHLIKSQEPSCEDNPLPPSPSSSYAPSPSPSPSFSDAESPPPTTTDEPMLAPAPAPEDSAAAYVAKSGSVVLLVMMFLASIAIMV